MDQLKDVILSTLAEIQEAPIQNEYVKQPQQKEEIQKQQPKVENKDNFYKEAVEKTNKYLNEDELLFLNSLRERMLVLFEGFQAPNNNSLESKIDLTLNFLEYVLSTIDTRIEQIKGK